MKKMLIIIGVIFILMIAGALYGKNKQSDWMKTVTANEMHTYPFPDSMPDVMLDPVPGFPVY